MGETYVAELKKPEHAVSRCSLTPVFATDGATVAVSVDRVFSAGDTVLSIADEQLDPNSKHAVRDLLMKHGPTEQVSVRLRRMNRELTVTAQCSDAKPGSDALLEAAFAASKGDASTCADKIEQASHLHASNYWVLRLAQTCRIQSGRLSNNTQQAQGFYEMNREAIRELAWSADALNNARGTVLTAVDTLHKGNAALLGDDLKSQYDQALAAASAPAALTAASTAGR
jgi:hypothetical protein